MWLLNVTTIQPSSHTKQVSSVAIRLPGVVDLPGPCEDHLCFRPGLHAPPLRHVLGDGPVQDALAPLRVDALARRRAKGGRCLRRAAPPGSDGVHIGHGIRVPTRDFR